MDTKNRDFIVGLVSLIVTLWLLVSVFPSIWLALFHSLLGNLVLVGAVLLVGMRSVPLAIALAATLVVLWRSYHM